MVPVEGSRNVEFLVDIPEDPNFPVILTDKLHSLQLAVIGRKGLKGLDDSWNAIGVYVLMDAPDQDGRWSGYVGKSLQFKSRLNDHLRNKPKWFRAILVKKPEPFAFDDTDISFLEAYLIEYFSMSPMVKLTNNNVGTKRTQLQKKDKRVLEQAIDGIQLALRLIGYETALDEEIERADRQLERVKQSSGSLAELLSHGFLKAGVALYPRYGASESHATVEANGEVKFNDKSYASLSAPGTLVAGHNVNGWEFWMVEDEEGTRIPIGVLRARLLKSRDSIAIQD